jgi:signal peptidase II
MQILALLSSALLLIILDQSSKAYVRHRIAPEQVLRVGVVAIRHQLNRRAFFAPLANGPVSLKLLVVLLIAEIAALAAITLYAPLMGGVFTAVALGIAAGGASSNVVDQVRQQGVVDFIDLGWWPVFNLADVAIVVGATSALACFVIPLVTARLGTA